MNRRGVIPIAAVALIAMAVWLAGYLTSQKTMREDRKAGMELARR